VGLATLNMTDYAVRNEADAIVGKRHPPVGISIGSGLFAMKWIYEKCLESTLDNRPSRRSEVGRVKPSVYFIRSRSPFAAPGLIDQ
jgi:hypothetical protein